MIFKSSEIRWFSRKKDTLWNVYTDLQEKGEGVREADRTDYYLKSGTINTGIKIREENHELKIKCGKDEDIGYGIIEHWIKWSTPETKNILNTIDERWLDDWLTIEKKRFKKSYEIIEQKKLKPAETEFINEGCGVEFTEIQLPNPDLVLYTLGMEAFSATNHERLNLLTTLNHLDINKSPLKELDSCGYPQMLHRLGRVPG